MANAKKAKREEQKEEQKVEYIKSVGELASYIHYYLSETIMDVTYWDCEHLAINMLQNDNLQIVKPDWWDLKSSGV